MRNKPNDIPLGTKVSLIDASDSFNFKGPRTLSECSIYTVINSFHYHDMYHKGTGWSTFITLINDKGRRIKVNFKRFKIISDE